MNLLFYIRKEYIFYFSSLLRRELLEEKSRGGYDPSILSTKLNRLLSEYNYNIYFVDSYLEWLQLIFLVTFPQWIVRNNFSFHWSDKLLKPRVDLIDNLDFQMNTTRNWIDSFLVPIFHLFSKFLSWFHWISLNLFLVTHNKSKKRWTPVWW